MKIEACKICREFLRDGRGTNVFRAVEETDFEIRGGSLVEIVGRSGSGKTTFVNMLAGLLVPTSGTVKVDDLDLYAMSDDDRSVLRNRKMGIMPQGQTGLSSLTVLENITAAAKMYGSDRDEDELLAAAMQLMEEMEIAELSNVYSNELSGGELRRLSIARALINDPDFIIADEPTGDLDDDTTKKILDILRERTDKGTAVLMVTHDREALSYADAVYCMEKGVLKTTG